MKVRYLLTISQIHAINALTNIPGIILGGEVNSKKLNLVEYDITSDQNVMLDSLLGQKGSTVGDKLQWPSEGDIYYYIDNDGDILKRHWNMKNEASSIIDICRHDIGNIFKTESDAYFEKERLKVLNQLKRLSDDDQEWNDANLHYYIAYDLGTETFAIWSFSSTKLPYNIYFKSKASAEAAIKTIGEDKLKKYVFNVKEKEN